MGFKLANESGSVADVIRRISKHVRGTLAFTSGLVVLLAAGSLIWTAATYTKHRLRLPFAPGTLINYDGPYHPAFYVSTAGGLDAELLVIIPPVAILASLFVFFSGDIRRLLADEMVDDESDNGVGPRARVNALWLLVGVPSYLTLAASFAGFGTRQGILTFFIAVTIYMAFSLAISSTTKVVRNSIRDLIYVAYGANGGLHFVLLFGWIASSGSSLNIDYNGYPGVFSAHVIVSFVAYFVHSFSSAVFASDFLAMYEGNLKGIAMVMSMLSLAGLIVTATLAVNLNLA